MMLHIKHVIAITLTAFLAFVCIASADADVSDSSGFPLYLGSSAGVMLPGGGNNLRACGAAQVFAGVYAGDYCALELSGACAPGASSGRTALTSLSARALFHLSGIETFDKLFGCERFDPFVTIGAGGAFCERHEFAHESRRTAIGPEAGIGAFYHLTQNLDLRFDARAFAGIDSPTAMLYTVVAGIQWNFGGGGE